MRLAPQKIYATLKVCVSLVLHSLCILLHCFADTDKKVH